MEINFRKAKFSALAATIDQCPAKSIPEIVMSGRSNVGKSSLINALCDNRKLARVSQTPGKTRAVVFFDIDDKLRIADLPGYGYAKVSREKKSQFSSLADSYFTSGRQFDLVLHLMDIRREPSDEDVAMLEYMNANNIRYFVVFTKCDKYSAAGLRRRLEELKDIYDFDENADIFAISSDKKLGIDQLREAIAKLLI
ncbi:MAG: YihA family ribosome biogenesis GTP-binding protein [Clostridiales bacterium]|nr:YihA family ribosome biogenesis GTP-binding protein [Clostridiales bacterium]